MAKYMMIALSVCLLLATSWSLSDARDLSWILGKLRARLDAEAEQLAPQMNKINDDLTAKLTKYSSLEETYRCVEELLAAISKQSDQLESNPVEKRALEMLVSLEELASSCNLDSLIKFELLTFAIEKFSKLYTTLRLVKRIVRARKQEHAEICGPVYKQDYSNLIDSLDSEAKQSVERVRVALDMLIPEDFSQIIGISPETMRETLTDFQQEEVIMMPNFKIHLNASVAVEKIVYQIAKQPIESPRLVSSIEGFRTSESQLRSFFEEFLFKPCAQFRNKLGYALQPAVLLATFSTMEQQHYIAEDPKFFHAMLNFGLCEKLLEEREQLYPIFIATIRNVPSKQLE